MPEPLRASMESAFDLDLSPVRVHEDEQARSMGALAFTRGTDIHFAPGHYRPETPRGRALLGHELAHVVQQAQGRASSGESAGLEREADVAGARAARGERASLAGPTRALRPNHAGPVQRKIEVATGDLKSAGFTDWSYVAYLGEGVVRLRFCHGSDCEAKGEAIGTIGWVTNNPTHLDVSDDAGKPAANAARASGMAYKSSETKTDATGRFSRFAIFSDSGKGLAGVLAVWKAFYEGQKKTNPNISLAEIIKLHKGLEPSEKIKLDAIQDPAARKAADPREKHLTLTRSFMIEALVKDGPMSESDATRAVDQVLATSFASLVTGGPDQWLNAAHMFNLLGTLQAVARTEGSAKPSGVLFRLAGDAFEHDPATRYSKANQTRISALEASAAVKAELRGLLGAK